MHLPLLLERHGVILENSSVVKEILNTDRHAHKFKILNNKKGRGFVMTDHSNSNLGRKPVAESPQTRNSHELYQTRTILERQLSVAAQKDAQAVAILERALALVEQVSSAKNPPIFCRRADHIRSVLALLDNR
ncbi:MAG: hypothetical protein R3F53_05350 [Gammaproteobacteria bacterium]